MVRHRTDGAGGQVDQGVTMSSQPHTAWMRAAVGLAQGAVLYLLYRAVEAKAWPATEPPVFASLLMTAIFVPVVVIAGLGNLRARTLAVWTLVAAAICAGLALHDVLRDPVNAARGLSGPRLIPDGPLWPALLAVLLILHSLIVAGEGDRRIVAGYPRLFDASWKHGVQLTLSVAFVAAFWVLLYLSAELFRLIGIRSLADLIQRPWFAAPATTVSFAYALHVTDVRADLVRGVRALALTLLAWLLPMLTAFAVAFLLALAFTGLEPLWSTRHATVTLLAAAAGLIVLINAAHQDGQTAETTARVVRHARSPAALALVPLVALAAYALALRAQQYGWTPERIVAGAAIVVAACYALGYGLAALRPNLDLKGLEPTNVAAAAVIVVVVLAVFSPVADPARIAVADQLRRLETGRVTPEAFDYRFLRFRAGRYGRAALERLAARTDGPNAAAIAERARQAMAMQTPGQPGPPTTPAARAKNIAVVHPAGQALPAGFVEQDWAAATDRQWLLPRCLVADARCEAALLDLDGDGGAEVVLLPAAAFGPAGAFKAGADGRWIWLGSIANVHCRGVRDAWKAGRWQPVEPPVKDIDTGGFRLQIIPPPGGCR
jgi:hypothetical protein